MAHFRKTKTNKWRVEVRRKGVYRSAVFYSKADGREWATKTEREIDTGKLTARSTKTLGDAFTRYSKEVSPKKKGRRWEQIRLKKLGQDRELADTRFLDLTAEVLVRWRDRRSQDVSSASVNREINLVSAVITQARRVWGWIDVNPMKDVARLTPPPPRDRRISDDEIERMCWALGFISDDVTNSSHETAVAFRIAIETGMRLSEIVGIENRHVHYQDRYVYLPDTKNSESRKVPLSLEAMRLMRLLPAKGRKLFSVSPGTASSLFRRARVRAEIDDLTFHDSRHEACSRLAQKIDVLDLQRMLGIKDPRILKVYYNATPHEIAGRLDAAEGPSAQPQQEPSEDVSEDRSESAGESPSYR